MAFENLRRWTCDICDNKVETDLNAQPEGWTFLAMGSPPLKALESEERRHLCISCTTRVSLALLTEPVGNSA